MSDTFRDHVAEIPAAGSPDAAVPRLSSESSELDSEIVRELHGRAQTAEALVVKLGQELEQVRGDNLELVKKNQDLVDERQQIRELLRDNGGWTQTQIEDLFDLAKALAAQGRTAGPELGKKRAGREKGAGGPEHALYVSTAGSSSAPQSDPARCIAAAWAILNAMADPSTAAEKLRELAQLAQEALRPAFGEPTTAGSSDRGGAR